MNTEIEVIEDNQNLTIIDRSLEQFKDAAGILKNNQTRAEKAVNVGKGILADYDAAGGKMTPELDQRMQNYLANCNKAKTEMNENRKGITQTLTMIAKAFTTEENKLDAADKATIAYQMQQIRNAYAKQLHEEEERRQREVELHRLKDQEAINIKAEAEKRLIAYAARYTSEEKIRINNTFNAISLENFEEKSGKLVAMEPAYPYAHFQQFQHGIVSRVFNAAEIDTLLKVHIESKFTELAVEYKNQITELQAYLIDRLPSKKQELLSIKQMEEEREAERKEQERIQQEQLQASAKRKQELETERLASLERQRLADIERQRLAEEQRLREEDERQRLAFEEEERQRLQVEQVDQNKAVEQTMSLFNNEVELADATTAKPEARKGYEIEVTGSTGWMQIFQQWFNETGRSLDNEKIATTKMESMKTFCEKLAHKDESKKIASNFLTYKPSFKAVNRKAA